MTDDATAARDVVVADGGVAGLSATVFTARQGPDTHVVDPGESTTLDATRERFAEPHPDPQETHPSLED